MVFPVTEGISTTTNVGTKAGTWDITVGCRVGGFCICAVAVELLNVEVVVVGAVGGTRAKGLELVL